MTSLLFNKTIRPTPAETWIDSDGSLNLQWSEYDHICRTELLFLCKILASVCGHATEEERLSCIRYFRTYGMKCIIRPGSTATESIWKIKYDSEIHQFTHLWMRACRGTVVSVEGKYTVTTSLVNCPPIKFFPLERFQEYYGRSAEEILFPTGNSCAARRLIRSKSSNVQESESIESINSGSSIVQESETIESSKSEDEEHKIKDKESEWSTNNGTPIVYQTLEKVDGSFITIYWDGKEVTANTLGSFGESVMQARKPTFKDCALSYLTEEALRYLKFSKASLICELVTPDNKIVSKYAKEGLCLLYIVTEDQDIVEQSITDNIFKFLFREHPNWWRPRSYIVNSMKDISELMSEISDLMPDVGTPEGFVLYCNDIPIGKIKTEEYKSMHKTVIMNAGSDRDLCAIDVLFYSSSPELEKYCAEYSVRQEYLSTLKEKHREISIRMKSLLEEYNLDTTDKIPPVRARLIMKYFQEPWVKRHFFENGISQDSVTDEGLRKFMLSTTKDGRTILESIQRNGPIGITSSSSSSNKDSSNKKEVKKDNTCDKKGSNTSGKKEDKKVGKKEEKKEDKKEEKEHRRKMAACFDFDGTLVEIDTMLMSKHKRKYKDNTLVSIWDRKASFQYVKPNEKVWTLLKGYNDIDIPTFIVTGRKIPVERKLYNYIQSQFEDFASIYLITLPNNCIRYYEGGIRLLVPDVCLAKKFVYSVLSRKYKCLVYEDDQKVLTEIKHLGCVGIRVADGNLEYPQNQSSSRPHIISLCGPPGSGKTTILDSVRLNLECNGVKVAYISSDVGLRNLNYELVEEIQKGPQVLLLDMCISSSVLRIIEKQRCPYTIYTHMPVHEGKVHPSYPHWCLNNVLNRDDHETLDSENFIECRDVVIQKTESSERMIPNCTLLYPDLYTQIENYISILQPVWKMKDSRSECKKELKSTYWPEPNEKPFPNKVWRPYRNVPMPLKNITCPSECVDSVLGIDDVLPLAVFTINVLTEKIISILFNKPKERIHPGFYFGLGISEYSIPPEIKCIPGQMQPLVHHVTLDVTDPLGPQKVESGSIHTLRSKILYTDSEDSMMAIEIEDTNLVEYPHVSLCWKGKPVDCRKVLESEKKVAISEISSEFTGHALYLV